MDDVAFSSNSVFKKKMLDRHRAAFTLWGRVASIMEDAISKDRTLSSTFARALDLFFIEAFKSHQSVYVLSVRGLGEDAATITRRLFEIALQVRYLCSEDAQREQRGAIYLAYFWHNAKDLLATDVPDDTRLWWEQRYERHKHLLVFNRNGSPAKFWFGADFHELAKELGLEASYDQDYRFLSRIAHCSSRGLLIAKSGNLVEINSDRMIDAILIFSTRYFLAIAAEWNNHFALVDTFHLNALVNEATTFDLHIKP